MIDIEGLNIEKVVHALFKNAIKSKAAQKRKEIMPNGCSFEQGNFEIAHLQRKLKQTGNKLDSIGCVQFNMDFSTNIINTDAYDLIHQTGSNEVLTAEEVIDTLTSDLLGHGEKLALHEFKDCGLTKKMLLLRKNKGEEFVEEHSLALSSLRKRQFSIHAALIEIAGLKIYQLQGIAQGLTRNEVTQLTPNEIFALSELKELGLSMEMLIAHRDKKNEFSIFHVSALISLIKGGSFSVKDGLIEIQGLNEDQARGLKHGLTRKEIMSLNSAEISALQDLKKFGLTADILINRRETEGEFTLLQGSALHSLIITRSFSVKDSLIQISGLKKHQLQGISNGLTYEEVIRLNDSWQIFALRELKAKGLTIEKLINQNEPDAFTETHWKLFQKLHEGAFSCQSIFTRVKALTKTQAEQELAMKTYGYSYVFFNKKKALESTHWFLQEPTSLPTVFSTNVSRSIEVHNKKPKFVKEIYIDQYESTSWQKSTGEDLPVTLYRLAVVFTNEDAEKAFYAATQKTMHFYAHSFGISFIENRYSLENINKELNLLLKYEDAPEAVYAIFEEKFGFHFEKSRGAQFAQSF